MENRRRLPLISSWQENRSHPSCLPIWSPPPSPFAPSPSPSASAALQLDGRVSGIAFLCRYKVTERTYVKRRHQTGRKGQSIGKWKIRNPTDGSADSRGQASENEFAGSLASLRVTSKKSSLVRWTCTSSIRGYVPRAHERTNVRRETRVCARLENRRIGVDCERILASVCPFFVSRI